MNQEYVYIHYEIAVIRALREHLLDKYVEMDHETKEPLMTEELPTAYAVVPQTILRKYLDRLTEDELALSRQLGEFEIRRKT